MTLTFVALRSALFASGFVWLWAWVALLLRTFDDALGGPLAPWSRAAGLLMLALGAAVAAWCIGAFVVLDSARPRYSIHRDAWLRGALIVTSAKPMYIGGALL